MRHGQKDESNKRRGKKTKTGWKEHNLAWHGSRESHYKAGGQHSHVRILAHCTMLYFFWRTRDEVVWKQRFISEYMYFKFIVQTRKKKWRTGMIHIRRWYDHWVTSWLMIDCVKAALSCFVSGFLLFRLPILHQFSFIAANLKPNDPEQWVSLAEQALQRDDEKMAVECYSKGRAPSHITIGLFGACCWLCWCMCTVLCRRGWELQQSVIWINFSNVLNGSVIE